MVGAMRAEHTGYEVPGWGTGDLWTGAGVVLAHELEFRLGTGRSRAPAPMGATRPPTRTLAASGAQLGDASVPNASHVEPPAPTLPDHALRPAALDPSSLVERFLAFFSGSDETFADVPIDLDWTTAFQRAVVGVLRAVPRGEIVAYGELASLAGYPGAARAVGTFCAHNRFMLIVPCHRVVGASGPGGYGTAGLEVKRRLLALEGVRL
jgi:methylated-DNA-[protein]-cysteine S-methyltransferase